MASYIEPDFKLLMLIHEMFSSVDADKKKEEKKRLKKLKKKTQDRNESM